MPSRGSVQQPVRFFDLLSLAREIRASDLLSVCHGAAGGPVEHTTQSFVSVVTRTASALMQLCEERDVSRAAVFASGCLELAPLYHALWLLGITVITIPSTQQSRQIVAQINNSDADILIHGSEQNLRLAAILPQLTSVKHRIVLASSGSGVLKGGEGVSYLHELRRKQSSTLADIPLSQFSTCRFQPDAPALIVFTTDDPIESHGVAFSEEALLHAARVQAQLYQPLKGGSGRRVWFLMPDKSLVRLLHTALLPLVSSIAVCEADSSLSFDRYPSFVQSQRISTIVVDDAHLELCRGCVSELSPDVKRELDVVFLSNVSVPRSRVEALQSVLVPVYGRTEMGGIVAVGDKGRPHFCSQGNPLGLELLSCGRPLGGVKLSVVREDGVLISNSEIGELVATSAQNMLSYQGSRPGDAFLGPRNGLHSGDTGYWSFDAQGMPHLVITGRASAAVERRGVSVYVSDVELSLYAIEGVEAARVVAFPHLLYGREVAAYILVRAGASVTRAAVWEALSKRFSWPHIPKIVLFGQADDRLPLPSHAALLETLQSFESTEFPEGMRA